MEYSEIYNVICLIIIEAVNDRNNDSVVTMNKKTSKLTTRELVCLLDLGTRLRILICSGFGKRLDHAHAPNWPRH